MKKGEKKLFNLLMRSIKEMYITRCVSSISGRIL